MAVLEVQGLGKHYRRGAAAYGSLRDTLMRILRRAPEPGTQVTALEDVSLELERGACLGVIGDNGAGKSTLLKVVARITPPDAGSVRVHGRVASLIELGAGFHPELTGAENVLLHGSILGLPRAGLRASLPAIAAYAGLEDAMDTPVKFFSTGMYARLGFAVAVHARPDLLLVDEVLSVGDLAFRERCYDTIRSLRRDGTAILFVSHDLPTVERLCDRAAHLSAGRIVASGEPATVVAGYRAGAQEA